MSGRILCTFPGRAGDLLWALPTIRAISEEAGHPVDLQIAGEFSGMVPLLNQQAYLRDVYADPRWALSADQSWQAPGIHSGQDDLVGDPNPRQAQYFGCAPYDEVYHLGYRRWPELPLPRETQWTYLTNYADNPLKASLYVDLTRPWITVAGPGAPIDIAVGFTEAWFELKLGVMVSLEQQFGERHPLMLLTPRGTRWTSEVGPGGLSILPCDWLQAAQAIRNSDLVLADCSALHVLACALGKPVIICEPMEGRHNPIFYPYGMDGPQVTVVRGNDGKPTYDARAVGTAIEKALKGQEAAR